ncbi:MAG: hypothetical protein ACI4MB_06510 [Candidatus Coproplasma sp.]
MEKQIIELYAEREAEKLRLANKLWIAAVSIVGAACLAACITLCCLVNARNVQQMMIAVMCTAVVGGWFVIYVCTSVIAENKHEVVHAKNMLDGERTEHEGYLSIGSQKLKIIGSITFVKATLTDGDKSENININVLKVKKLKNIKGRVKIYTAHGYAVALEVCDENN